MALSVVNPIAIRTGPTSTTLTNAAGVTTGDLEVLAVTNKPITETPSCTSTGTAWTLLGSQTVGEGTAGAGTGPIRVTIYYRVIDASGQGTTTVSQPTNNAQNTLLMAGMVYRKDAGDPDYALTASWGSDITSGTDFSATVADNLGCVAGDHMYSASATTTANTISARGVSVPGCTVTPTARASSSKTDGWDQFAWFDSYTINTGTQTGAATITATVGTAATGGTGTWRLTLASAAPNAGSATGTYAFAGSAVGDVPPNVGSASGTYAFAGSATGDAPVVAPKQGSASGSFAFAGTATGEATKQGTSTGTYAFAGATSGKAVKGGTATGTASFAGAATGSAPVVGAKSGSATGGYAFSGASTGARAARGQTTGGFALAGSAAGSAPAVATPGYATGYTGGYGTASSAGGSAAGGFAFAGTATGTAPSSHTALRGINVSSAEFTPGSSNAIQSGLNNNGTRFSNVNPGVHGTDYAYDSRSSYTYTDYSSAEFLYNRGFRYVKVPLRWERVQPTLNAALNATQVGYINEVLDEYDRLGMRVILDIHNYGIYYYGVNGDRKVVGVDPEVPVSAFTDLWTRMATAFSSHPAVHGFALMNEPQAGGGMTAAIWKTVSQAGVDAIRSVTSSHIIYVSGFVWGDIYRWSANNGAAWINDPTGNFRYEAHSYWSEGNDAQYTTFAAADAYAVGQGHAAGVNPNANTTRVLYDLAQFKSWCDTYGVQGCVGEYGWLNNHDTVGNAGDQAKWDALADAFLDALDGYNMEAIGWACGEFYGPLTGGTAGAGLPMYVVATWPAPPARLSVVRNQALVVESHLNTEARSGSASGGFAFAGSATGAKPGAGSPPNSGSASGGYHFTVTTSGGTLRVFTTPTAREGISGDRLFSRYSMSVGVTVVKKNGVYVNIPYPWLGELDGLEDGVDYFLGGRAYHVSEAVAADLAASGYTTG